MQKENIEKGRRIKNQRMLLIGLLDCLATFVVYFAGLWIRFDFSIVAIPEAYFNAFMTWIAPWCVLNVAIFMICGLYNSIWSFVSTSELFRIVLSYGVLGVILTIVDRMTGSLLPRSSLVIGFFFSFMATVTIRFSYRLLRALRILVISKDKGRKKNVMVIGAGDAGRSLVNEFINSSYIHEIGRASCRERVSNPV